MTFLSWCKCLINVSMSLDPRPVILEDVTWDCDRIQNSLFSDLKLRSNNPKVWAAESKNLASEPRHTENKSLIRSMGLNRWVWIALMNNSFLTHSKWVSVYEFILEYASELFHLLNILTFYEHVILNFLGFFILMQYYLKRIISWVSSVQNK